MELWQRKLRNGQRRGLVKVQERMWEKLTSEHETKHGNIRMSPGVPHPPMAMVKCGVLFLLKPFQNLDTITRSSAAGSSMRLFFRWATIF